jgi:hypothetical protein
VAVAAAAFKATTWSTHKFECLLFDIRLLLLLLLSITVQAGGKATEDVRGSSPTQYEEQRQKRIAENTEQLQRYGLARPDPEQEECHKKPLDTDPDGINEDGDYIDDDSDVTQEEFDDDTQEEFDDNKDHAELIPEPEVRY